MASLPDLSAVRANLAFTCTHEAEHLPPLDPVADSLFQYGRYLEKKDGPKDFNEVARYYRIAAAHGHYKANHNLQILVSEGSAASPDPEKESIVLAEQLIEAGVPSGYYDIGHYLLHGYGLKEDEDMGRGVSSARPPTWAMPMRSITLPICSRRQTWRQTLPDKCAIVRRIRGMGNLPVC